MKAINFVFFARGIWLVENHIDLDGHNKSKWIRPNGTDLGL